MGDGEKQSHHRQSVDLAAVILLAAVGTLLAIVDTRASILRFIFGTFLALFAPGYAVMATLFPGERISRNGALSAATQIVLSIAVSAVLVPMVSVSLQYAEIGIRRTPVALSLFTLTVLFGVVAHGQRRHSISELQFESSPRTIDYAEIRRQVAEFSSVDRVLYGVLVLGLIVATAGAGYAIVSPDRHETTEFYLLSEDRSGNLSASEYPTELTANEPALVSVAIENQEGQAEQYTVVVQLQRVEERSENPQVVNATEVSRYSKRVDDGRTSLSNVTVTPRIAGTNQRLSFKLYRGEAANSSPYRELYLWVNVSANGTERTELLEPYGPSEGQTDVPDDDEQRGLLLRHRLLEIDWIHEGVRDVTHPPTDHGQLKTDSGIRSEKYSSLD